MERSLSFTQECATKVGRRAGTGAKRSPAQPDPEDIRAGFVSSLFPQGYSQKIIHLRATRKH